MCELLSTLFPGETAIYQCNNCGKLVPKSLSADHSCERNDLNILGVSFHRDCLNKYLCLKCNQIVHSAFLYPHVDGHNHEIWYESNKSDISYLANLIINSDIKNVEKTSILETKAKKSGESGSNSLIQSLKSKVNYLFGSEIKTNDDVELPAKRKKHHVICVDNE